MCVTFLASVPSDSDTIQISTEGKGGINETALPTRFCQCCSAFVRFIICTFHVTLKTDSIYNQNTRLKTTQQDDLQGPI